VGVSVVRESTQGSAAADRDDDEISVPQLTQEGQCSFLAARVVFRAFPLTL